MSVDCPTSPAPLLPASATPVANPPAIADLMQGSGVLMGLFDTQDRLQQANTVFLQAYHVRLQDRPTWADLLRDNYTQRRGVIINTPDFEAWLASARSRRGQQAFRAFETDLWDGRWLWMTEAMQPDGWMLCLACDITQLKASEHALRRARDQALAVASTDPLTGIGNRRHVLERLAQMLKDLREPGDLLSVVVADLDAFKQVNDRFGHPAGDAVLQDFSRRALRLLSACGGTVGRVGGEEFMLLLPSCSTIVAEQYIAKLHAQVRQAHPVPSLPHCSYRFSAGIARAHLGESPDTVFQRADLALYEAKQAGRNRTVRADD